MCVCVCTPHAPMYNRNAVTIHQSKGLLLCFFLSYYYFFSCSYYYLTSFGKKKTVSDTDEFDFRISVTYNARGARRGYVWNAHCIHYYQERARSLIKLRSNSYLSKNGVIRRTTPKISK